ncbi:helix-turn-helix transcriptional regulator [Streptomyces sp. NPDC048551]|uniref:helix-turn-helix domain-containing protein n=1 Tax=Streptomyces sp. NPDC048551 TaxID=3155758 RepID=UPI0034228D1B
MSKDPPPEWVLARRRAIGARLRDARTAAGLSQEGLALRAGIDLKTVHRIEYAISDPTLSVLLLVAAAVRVPLSELVRERE